MCPLQRHSPSCCVALLLAGVLGTAGRAAEPSSAPTEANHAGQLTVYVGTYTRGDSEGIYVYRMDLATGRMKRVGLAGGIENPSFLALHPNGRFLYAVSEVSNTDGRRTGAVSAFALDPQTGLPNRLNHQPSEGAGPCHLVVDRDGRAVLVANYGTGNVAVLPIREDGSLGPATDVEQHEGSSVNPRRQAGPHAHSINVDPANRFAVAADLGIDKLLIYRFHAEGGTLTPNDPPFARVKPGAGPRHFDFHPGGQFAYVINELHSTVTAFSYDAQSGRLETLQTVSTLPDDFEGDNTTAEIQVHPSGRFLYGSNRGHDSIAIFAVDPKTGRLSPVGHEPTQGKTPRNFGIDPTGTYLLAANQTTDEIAVFRIDPETGRLAPTGEIVEVPTPVCVKFLKRNAAARP